MADFMDDALRANRGPLARCAPQRLHDAIQKVRQQRLSAFLSLLARHSAAPDASSRTVWPESKLGSRIGCALLEHRLRSLALLAKAGDAIGVARLSSSEEPLSQVRIGASAAIVAADMAKALSTTGDEPAYVIGTTSVHSASDFQVDVAEAALQAARKLGDEKALDAVGTVVLLTEHDLFGTSNSWTTRAMPGTIYTDWTADPMASGCAFIHEASHLWLNEAFRATRFPAPSDQLYFSPWKGEPRYQLGFLHAAFAFSMVSIYCARALESQPAPPTRRVLEMTQERERSRLSLARATLEQAVQGIDDDVASTIAAACSIALNSLRC